MAGLLLVEEYNEVLLGNAFFFPASLYKHGDFEKLRPKYFRYDDDGLPTSKWRQIIMYGVVMIVIAGLLFYFL